jgi:hypothetical protein
MSGSGIIEILQAGGWVGTNKNNIGGAQGLGEAMAKVLGVDFPELVTDEEKNVIDPKIEERRAWILEHYDEYVDKLEELRLDAINDATSSGLGVAGYLGSTAEYGYQAYKNEEL